MGMNFDKREPLNCATIIKNPSSHGGGIAAVALPLHIQLNELGANANLVCVTKPEREVVNLFSIGKNGFGALYLPKSVMRDVVHIHGIWTSFEIFLGMVARRRGAKVIVSPHGALEPWAFKSKGFKKKLAWYLYQKKSLLNADLLIVNSDQERDNLRALGLNGAIAVIPNGVVLDGYDKSAAAKIERSKIVLYFSRLDRKKGIELLVKSWKKIEDKRGYKLHIQGYGDEGYKRSLRELVSHLELNEYVEFIEPSYSGQRWVSFTNASIYILPSYSENFGITVAEALFSGLPSITTTEMPWKDLPKEKIGWSVKCNETDITQALTDAISLEENELAKMRYNAIDYAEKRFLWKNIVKEYELVYRWVLQPSKETMPNNVTTNIN